MIDFRYHLVSIISVFLALAVGIILGAGPLRDTISDQLTGQVEQLRKEKDDLRVELERAQAAVLEERTFIEATGPRLIDGLLPEHRVALVRLPGASDDVVAALTTRLEESGAEVVSQLEVTELWASPDQGAFRTRVAREVTEILTATSLDPTDPPLEVNGEGVQVLAAGLAVALQGADALDPRSSSNRSTDVLAALSEGNEPLVTGTVGGPADLVLVVTAPTTEPAEGATLDPTLEPLREGWATALQALAASAPTVTAGYATTSLDLLPAIRSDGGVTTVDGVDDVVGQLTVPLALAAVASGEGPVAYGFGIGAQAAVPPAVTLEPPAVLQPTPEPTEVATQPSDGTTPAEGETPADGTAPSEGETPAEGETPSEGETPAEGEASSEGEALAEASPQLWSDVEVTFWAAA